MGEEFVRLVVVELEVVVLDELDDELEVELEELLDDELLDDVVVVDEDVGAGAGLVDVLELLALAGAHDSFSETIGPVIGRFMAEIGVPGGTLTLNV